MRFEEGRIEFRLAGGGRPTLATDLSRALEAWTGRRWLVALSKEPGAPTLAAAARDATETRHRDAATHPLVREVLARFPGAQIVNVRDRTAEAGDDVAAVENLTPPDAAGAGEDEDTEG